ncbi:MAG: DUF192 domain-containing protein [Gammaproteobacteria bacterium]
MARHLLALLALIALSTGVPEQAVADSECARPWSFAHTLRVGEASFNVAVASTGQERMRGLSGVCPMAANEGLYFVFPAPGLLPFWMKDMRFPLDIVWIDAQHRVIHIRDNVAPETFPAVFAAEQPARYVLEINAGRAREAGIQVGDVATLDQPPL